MGNDEHGTGFVGGLEELSDPATAAGLGDGRRPTRRQLLLGAGAVLAGGSAWALSRPRHRPPTAAPQPAPPSLSGRAPLWTYHGTGSYALARFDRPPTLPVFLSDSGLTGLDPATGRSRYHLDLAPGAMLVVGAEQMFRGSGVSAVPSGRIDRWDLATGQTGWSYAPPAQTPGKPVDAQPLACDGTVLYCTNEQPGNGLSGSALVAVDVPSRQVRWSLPGAPDAWLLGAATAPGGRLLCGDTQKGLTVLNTADGRRLWSAATGGYLGWQTADEQHVYLGLDTTGVQALSLADGTVSWQVAPRADQSWHYLQPLAAAGSVYLFTDDGLVTAHAADSGRQIWSATLPFRLDTRNRPLLVAGTLVVPGTADGGVVALDAATGAVRWTFRDSSPGVDVWTVSTDGRRIFAGRDAYLHALPVTG
ncbi:PQQ-binding-like beta-propeller repeat protein [Kitasatospora sp. MAA4]|uniref:outer membrane protein assembly factor BamB family protein n=1 Tax=Kitasatospora sp. MAA4 TaxID=3035093 RepID=UPI002473433C|nr:PQQ-binding-like beta-propeller repeat protein [Kitasatospora sp. MAA4]